MKKCEAEDFSPLRHKDHLDSLKNNEYRFCI